MYSFINSKMMAYTVLAVKWNKRIKLDSRHVIIIVQDVLGAEGYRLWLREYFNYGLKVPV